MHTFNPSTWEAERGESLSSRPAWSTKWVLGQAPKLQRNPVSKTKTKTLLFNAYVHVPECILRASSECRSPQGSEEGAGCLELEFRQLWASYPMWSLGIELRFLRRALSALITMEHLSSPKFFSLSYYFYLCVCLYLYVCMLLWVQFLQRPEGGAGNWTQALWKGRTCS